MNTWTTAWWRKQFFPFSTITSDQLSTCINMFSKTYQIDSKELNPNASPLFYIHVYSTCLQHLNILFVNMLTFSIHVNMFYKMLTRLFTLIPTVRCLYLSLPLSDWRRRKVACCCCCCCCCCRADGWPLTSDPTIDPIKPLSASPAWRCLVICLKVPGPGRLDSAPPPVAPLSLVRDPSWSDIPLSGRLLKLPASGLYKQDRPNVIPV